MKPKMASGGRNLPKKSFFSTNEKLKFWKSCSKTRKKFRLTLASTSPFSHFFKNKAKNDFDSHFTRRIYFSFFENGGKMIKHLLRIKKVNFWINCQKIFKKLNAMSCPKARFSNILFEKQIVGIFEADKSKIASGARNLKKNLSSFFRKWSENWNFEKVSRKFRKNCGI